MSYLPPPLSLTKGFVVDAYIRDSGGPRQDESSAQQLAEIETYCQAHGLQLRHRFVDEARSGGSTIGRDEFNRMVDLYRRPEDRPAGLLLWNYARFARDLDDAIYYKALLRNRGIIVHSLTDPIPEGQYGRIIEFFIDISNEEKRRQTSTDAKRGLRDLVQKYGCVPGVPPRGFIREPVTIGQRRDGAPHMAHRWVPDPELVPMIRKAFAMRAAGASLIQIQRETQLYKALNGYKTFFTNPLYIGELHYGEQTFKGYCEPIIDPATWNAVQAIIRKHAARHGARSEDHTHPRRKNSSFLLAGLVRCARCTSPLYGQNSPQRGKGIDLSYRCTRGRRRRDCGLPRIPAYILEETVLNGLEQAYTDPGLVLEAYELALIAYDNWQTNHDSRRRELMHRRPRIRRRIDNYTDAIGEAGKSQALMKSLDKAEQELAACDADLAALELERPSHPVEPQVLRQKMSGLAERIKELADVQTSQAILRGLIAAVRVDRQEHILAVQLGVYYPGDDLPLPFLSSPWEPEAVSSFRAPVGAPRYETPWRRFFA